MKSFTAILETDPITGEAVLPLSDEFCKEHDWQPGDDLEMEVKGTAIHITNLSWQARNRKVTG